MIITLWDSETRLEPNGRKAHMRGNPQSTAR
jgi:hypothetical protein